MELGTALFLVFLVIFVIGRLIIRSISKELLTNSYTSNNETLYRRANVLKGMNVLLYLLVLIAYMYYLNL